MIEQVKMRAIKCAYSYQFYMCWGRSKIYLLRPQHSRWNYLAVELVDNNTFNNAVNVASREWIIYGLI